MSSPTLLLHQVKKHHVWKACKSSHPHPAILEAHTLGAVSAALGKSQTDGRWKEDQEIEIQVRPTSALPTLWLHSLHLSFSGDVHTRFVQGQVTVELWDQSCLTPMQ